MIVSLCAALFDYGGNFLFSTDMTDSDFSHVARRVSRSATLDGGCIIVDNGYSPSDATFTIVPRDISNAERLGLLGMIQRHSALTVAVGENVFRGVVETVEDKDKLKIKFLVQEKLNG
jgi:mevalonate pyrophosphate decarboxylase